MGSFSEIYKSFLLEGKQVDEYENFKQMYDDYQNNDLLKIFNLFKITTPRWPTSAEIFSFARENFKRQSVPNLKQLQLSFNGQSGTIENFNLFYLVDFLFFLQEANRGKEDLLLSTRPEDAQLPAEKEVSQPPTENTENVPPSNNEVSSNDLRILLSRLFKP